MSDENKLATWELVNAARSVPELIEFLEQIGPVEISGGRGAFDMASRVKEVAAGVSPINALTRNFGIRQQYIYLVQS